MTIYYTKSGVIREIAVVVAIVLVIAFIGCVLYFGLAAQAREAEQAANSPLNPINTIAPITTTIAPIIYQEPESLQMYRTNGRYLGDFFSWKRYNVSMGKDLEVRVTAYKYRELDSYHWWNPQMGQYYNQLPNPGKKFLIVQVYMEAVGDNPEWDARMWTMGQDHFYLQVGTSLIRPSDNYLPCLVIRELETTYSLNDDSIIQPYGYWGLTNGSCVELSMLHMGSSNAVDGFIVYEIDQIVDPADVILIGQYGGFGQSYWKLKEEPG